jgi:hypothetical protein
VFECVYLRPADHQITTIHGYEDSAERIEGGAYWVEPRLREDSIIVNGGGYDRDDVEIAILRRIPVHFEDRALVAGRGVPE